MLICGHCGDTVKDLHGLAVHLRCEQKPLPLVVVENTSTNTARNAICPHWETYNRGGSGEFGACNCGGKISSDYTAALRAELSLMVSAGEAAYNKISIDKAATRLNSVVKAQQNCA